LDIFDSYFKGYSDALSKQKERDKNKNAFGDIKKDEVDPVEEASKEVFVDTNPYNQQNFVWAVKLMERMVNLNAEESTYNLFAYWTSEGDRKGAINNSAEFKELWTFRYQQPPSADDVKISPKAVTSMVWNPYYTDMFAVGYGTYDYQEANDAKASKLARGGSICLFSLKNTMAPERILEAPSGVISLSFHQHHPTLLCCGLYDGSVLVFDISSTSGAPLFQSVDPKTKHTDPVWQVAWNLDPKVSALNFFSISIDGRVTNWFLNKTELTNEEVIEIRLNPAVESDNDEEIQEDDTLVGLAGGSCFDFNTHPSKAGLFVVGTEEGGLHSYSRSVGSAFVSSFAGHHQAVYTVKWNPFHPAIFLTCSADWTVKLWEINNTEPVMTFDCQHPVSDISWAPFSSTVFAVGFERVVRVFDLALDKHAAVGQIVLSKNRASLITHLSFNPVVPILGVSMDNGTSLMMKLSGSLELAEDVNDIDVEKQILRLDDLLIINDVKGTATGKQLRAEAAAAKLESERQAKEKEKALAAASEATSA
jgi:dynein intermediate chain 1